MPVTDFPPAEVARRAKEIYERDIRPRVEAGNKGKIVAIDIISGDYAIEADDVAAYRRLRAKHDDAVVFELRVGYPTADKIGGSWGDHRP